MENTNFNLRIKRLPYSRLLKSEMADYVEKTIDIVESHGIESNLLAPMFVQLSDKESDIKLLRLSYGVDTERLKVNKLKGNMMLVISAFKIKVRLISKSNPELDMHVIQNAINKHLRNLHKCKNDKELNQKIAGFFDQASVTGELQTAVSGFELTAEVDAMKSAFKAVVEASKKRVRLLSLRPIVSTEVLVKGMSKAVDNLFKSIEVENMLSVVSDAPETGEQVELVALMVELNQLSEMYSRSIAIRDANNKRKANKDKQGQDGKEGGEDPSEPISTSMSFINDGGNGGDSYEDIITPFKRMNNPVDEDDTEELHDVDDDDVETPQ